MGSEHLLSQAASSGDSWQVAFDCDTHSQSYIFQWVWWWGGCSFSRNRRFHSSFVSRQTHWFVFLQSSSCSEYLPYFLFRSYCVSRKSLQSPRLRSGNPNVVLASLCSEYSLDALSMSDMDTVQSALSILSLDHIVICAFYAICRVYGVPVTFHSLLSVYSSYLEPFQSIRSFIAWVDVNRLWFEIDLSAVLKLEAEERQTMIELYNSFFVPLVYPVVEFFRQSIQTHEEVAKWGKMGANMYYSMFVWSR